jgi:hypothetical protein
LSLFDLLDTPRHAHNASPIVSNTPAMRVASIAAHITASS